jgi:hypothetical protein
MGNTTASSSDREERLFSPAMRRSIAGHPGYLMKLVHAQDIEGLEDLLSTAGPQNNFFTF